MMEKFGLVVYDTPGDGNCAIQGIMHHLNVAKSMNVDIWDLENVSLFRRFLCVEIMKNFLDQTISHPDYLKQPFVDSIKGDKKILFSSLYSMNNHYKYQKDRKLHKNYWLDHDTLFPLISYVLKMSICFFVSKRKAKKYKKKSDYISFICYDKKKPKEMSIYRQFNEIDERTNNEMGCIYDVDQFPHTMFIEYEFNQHYDVCVSKDNKFYQPRYKNNQNRKTRSNTSFPTTSFMDTEYYRSVDEYNDTLELFEPLIKKNK